MPQYTWLLFSTAKQQLAQRLSDPMSFWPDAELAVYIQLALRMFNSLTATWKQEFAYTDATHLWSSLGTLAGSPRLRTLTDTYCYTAMESMLLEPPTGAAWTGTNQFSISDLAGSLQRHRDQMLQVSNCNQVLMKNIALVPNTVRTVLPDNVIDAARVRFLPVANPYSGGAFTPGVTGFTLYRDDAVAQEWYESGADGEGLYQQPPGVPQTFMLSSEPPLTWDVDIPPAQPGTYEAVVLETGTPFNPPVNTLLGIPDDFVWVLIWGTLASLLGRESEATDRERAAYCAKRYVDGMTLLIQTPWIMLARVNGVAVTTDSLSDADRYVPEWDSTPTAFGPFVVTGGIDFLAGPVGSSIGVTVLGNAPVPAVNGDFVQVSRSNWTTVLDLAQVFAVFKKGGADWKEVLAIEAGAIRACAAENTRLKSTGAFSDVLMQRGQAEDRDQERYSTAAASKQGG